MKKGLAISVFLAYSVFASEASFHRTSSIALMSLTFCTMNVEVAAFFGIFRRRRPSPAPAIVQPKVEEMSSGPSGPIFPFSHPAGLFSNAFSGFGAGLPSMGIRRPHMFSNLFNRQGPRQDDFQQQMAQQMTDQQIPQHMQAQVFQQMQESPMNSFENFAPDQMKDSSPGLNTEEAESFFALLAETDESQCISRLICEMGADPLTAGEFGQTIAEIISNLRDFPPGTKVAHYNQVLQAGMQGGLHVCRQSFGTCDDESLQMVKNAQTSED